MAEEITDEFEVETEDGTVLTAYVYQTVSTFRPISGAPKNLYGAKRLALADGRHLNPVKGDAEAFQIFDTNEIVRKID